MRCAKCGNFLAFSLIPYQRIHRDKKTGHWVPSPGVCQCDPDDFSLFGLIKYKEEKDEKEREKQAKIEKRNRILFLKIEQKKKQKKAKETRL